MADESEFLLYSDEVLSFTEGTPDPYLPVVKTCKMNKPKFGTCPVCGGIGGHLGLAGIDWAICWHHQVRWCVGYTGHVEDDQAEAAARKSLATLRIVRPAGPRGQMGKVLAFPYRTKS